MSGVLSLVGLLFAVLMVSLIGTAVAMHGFDAECTSQGGTHTVQTWHGIPVESTCSY